MGRIRIRTGLRAAGAVAAAAGAGAAAAEAARTAAGAAARAAGAAGAAARTAGAAAAALALAAATAAHAAETIDYSYDPLGRLTQASRWQPGGDGARLGFQYDPAGNRARQTVSLDAAAPSTPPPPPSAPNLAPVTQDDQLATGSCALQSSVNVVANDHDPDGDPLTVTSVSGATLGTASVSSSGMSIVYNPNSAGTDTVTYTIADGKGGSATGRLVVTVAYDGLCQ
jgi:hypothetical protein